MTFATPRGGCDEGIPTSSAWRLLRLPLLRLALYFKTTCTGLELTAPDSTVTSCSNLRVLL